jgi:hypothetical protein
MGHDEDKNFNALDELNRISGNAVPASTSSSDIVLNNGSNTRSKKKVVFILIAILAIAAIALGVYAIVSKAQEKNKIAEARTLDTATLMPIKGDISKYLALLQNGNPDSTYDAEKSVSSWYTVMAVSDAEISAEKKYQHALKMYAQYDAITKAAKSLEDGKTKEQLVTVLEKQINSYRTTAEYLKNQSISDNVVKDYLKNGYESANNMLATYNESAKALDNEAWKNVYKKIIRVRELSLKAVDVLNQSGCVFYGTIDEGCVNNLYNNPELGSEFIKIENERSSINIELQSIASNYATAFCMSASGMGSVLKNENN